jgi:queuosine precursor transporter
LKKRRPEIQAATGSITQDKKMPSLKSYLPFVVVMTIVVVASNILVLYPFDHFGLKDVLTWGAFTYPVAFLVNDLTNRTYGKSVARRVVIVGFVFAVILSVWLATPRIAIASGAAFLTGQLLDIQVFDRLRRNSWWQAPFMGTVFGSMIDTLIFFTLAFAPLFAFVDLRFGMEDGSLGFPANLFGYEAPLWVTLAFGDFCVKMLMGVLALIPYGALLNVLKPVNSLR